MQQLKFIISGGGTGGHIFPAIAIANALKKAEPNGEILFVGAEGRMEMEKVPNAGYKIIGLPIMGLQRKLTLKNLAFPFKLIRSLLKAKKVVKDFAPNAVVGVGGYASGPTLKAANSKGIPTIIQEQNSYPGITNKLLAKKAKLICVAYDNMENFFPKEKIKLTGNPVRQDITSLENIRSEALEYFKLDASKKTVLVIGGSLGALTINKAILASLEKFQEKDIQLIWQTGNGFKDKAKSATANYSNTQSHAFITKMNYAYAVANVVISRAGALSISEICVTGKPSILVPSPNVAEDHQTKNAMALVSKNAALLVKDVDAEEALVSSALNLINDESKCNELRENLKPLAFKNAAESIANEIIKIAKQN